MPADPGLAMPTTKPRPQGHSQLLAAPTKLHVHPGHSHPLATPTPGHTHHNAMPTQQTMPTRSFSFTRPQPPTMSRPLDRPCPSTGHIPNQPLQPLQSQLLQAAFVPCAPSPWVRCWTCPGGHSHMGFSCPMSSSLVHLAHSFLSVLMEQRMGPHGFPQSSMAGTFR